MPFGLAVQSKSVYGSKLSDEISPKKVLQYGFQGADDGIFVLSWCGLMKFMEAFCDKPLEGPGWTDESSSECS